METLREKFTTVCQGCDGSGVAEEIYTTFGNEVQYRDVVCECEDGKELDWEKVDSEIFDTKGKIQIVQMSIGNFNEFMRDAMRNFDKSKAIAALQLLMEKEAELLELENYLDELGSIEWNT